MGEGERKLKQLAEIRRGSLWRGRRELGARSPGACAFATRPSFLSLNATLELDDVL